MSPGAQPFEFNALTLAHAWLVCVPLTVYLLAAAVFVPLAVVFGAVLVPTVFAIAFVFMYVPMQLGSGRLVYCLCPHLMTTRCCRPRANRTKRQEEEEEDEATGQNSSSGAAPDPAAEQAGLMTLKAMGTLFFALFALSVYFTPFFRGARVGRAGGRAVRAAQHGLDAGAVGAGQPAGGAGVARDGRHVRGAGGDFGGGGAAAGDVRDGALRAPDVLAPDDDHGGALWRAAAAGPGGVLVRGAGADGVSGAVGRVVLLLGVLVVLGSGGGVLGSG